NTSGVALQVEFQPLVEVIERKRPFFQRGCEKINYFILRYNQLVQGTMLPVDICAHCGGRIVEIQEDGQDGTTKIRRKCYLIDPQTLDFMDPEDVELNWKRKLSFGSETRMLPYKQIKKDYLKEGATYWDPGGEVDLEQKAADDHEKNRKLQQHVADQSQAHADHQAAMSDYVAEQSTAKPTKPGETAPPPPGPA